MERSPKMLEKRSVQRESYCIPQLAVVVCAVSIKIKKSDFSFFINFTKILNLAFFITFFFFKLKMFACYS